MKKTNVITVGLISAALLTGALAFGHSNSTNMAQFSGHHMGGMGGMMSMNYDQRMFDVEKLTKELELTNEQTSLLSQVESTHIAMQEIMRAKALENDGNFSHRGMMSVMSENFELMESHHNLFDQFEATLSDEQRTKWDASLGDCH